MNRRRFLASLPLAAVAAKLKPLVVEEGHGLVTKLPDVETLTFWEALNEDVVITGWVIFDPHIGGEDGFIARGTFEQPVEEMKRNE